MEIDRYSSSSPRQKLRKSLGFSFLFRRDNRERETLDRKQQQQQRSRSISSSPSSTSSYTKSHCSTSQPKLLRSATATWERSKADERCLSLLCGSPRGKCRRNSDDFKYDPLSYSLNFDEGSYHSDQSDEFLPMRSFSARLPASPTLASPRSEKRVVAETVSAMS